MIKAVLFDIDNTMIDFMKMKRACCTAAINAMADASSVDLTLFKAWYHQSGTPVLCVKESFLNELWFPLTMRIQMKA